MQRSFLTAFGVLAALSASAPARAVETQIWTHEQPKDFLEGQLEDVVVSSFGEVTLGGARTTLYELKEDGEIINAVVQAGDGRIYAGTGPYGVIYQMDGDNIVEFSVLPAGGTILSLLFTRDGQLLVGTGGSGRAKIYRVDGNGKVSIFYEPPDVTYIWAMARGPDGEIYAATGTDGQLFKIAADGSEGEVLADLKPKNLLCLAMGPAGTLYAGSDEDGLVYRIGLDNGKAFVVYDAKEPEISSMVFDGHGNLYAATADASAARPGREVADKPGGRPDHSDRRTTDSPRISVVKRSPPETRPATSTQPANTKKSSATKPSNAKRVGHPVAEGSKQKDGNAVYRIDSDGFVTEVFREPVIIFDMVETDGTLYIGTGNEGRVYAITPDEDRTVMLARLDSAQATTLLRLPDHRLIIGTANAPMLIELADQYARKGTLTSKVLDADQAVNWGRLWWNADISDNTRLTVATRSSNVEDEESEAWDDWSSEMDASTPQQIPSLPGRFFQYRLTLETSNEDQTPTLHKLEIAYIAENRPPLISSLTVRSAFEEASRPGCPAAVKAAAGLSRRDDDDAPAPMYNWVVKWGAADPNKDELTCDVYYRDYGRERWIRMAKEVDESFHIWDTQTVPDGKYEVRIVVSDRLSNPSGAVLSSARISDPVLVDNTPPDAKINTIRQDGDQTLSVKASLSDSGSRISAASYSIDSNDKWRPLAAADDVFDSPSESVSFKIDDLEPGEHRVVIRVSDSQGNIRYVSESATISD